jgi:hypothetical protein
VNLEEELEDLPVARTAAFRMSSTGWLHSWFEVVADELRFEADALWRREDSNAGMLASVVSHCASARERSSSVPRPAFRRVRVSWSVCF